MPALAHGINHDLAQRLRHRVMDEDISAFGGDGDGRHLFGVARDHHRAAAVVEAVADRRRRRRMIDLEGGDGQAVVLEYLDESAGRRGTVGQGKRPRHQRRRCWWHDVCAVVRGAIDIIERIGLVETVDHLRNAVRTKHGERLTPAADPGLHAEFTEVADVVGMKVREQDRGDARAREIHQRQRLPRLKSGIDDVGPSTGDHRDAALGHRGGRIRQRRGKDEVPARITRSARSSNRSDAASGLAKRALSCRANPLLINRCTDRPASLNISEFPPAGAAHGFVLSPGDLIA